MSKWIILAGLIFCALSGVFFVLQDQGWWAELAMNLSISIGVVATIGGTVSLILRADW